MSSPPNEPNEPNESNETDETYYNLDDIFISKDYTTISITIPCYIPPKNDLYPTNHESTVQDNNGVVVSNNPQTRVWNEGSLTIDMKCSMAASTDFDLTGQIIWPVSELLAHYLASKRGQDLLTNHNVVELGAGCGLPGLIAAHYAKQVIVTDGNPNVMELLEQNCASFTTTQPQSQPCHTTTTTSKSPNPNSHPSPSQQSPCSITARTLVWGNIQDIQTTKHQMNSVVDVVIAADVVQWPAVVEPFLHSTKALLWDSTCPEPKCIIGLVDRASSTTQQFFNCAKELGFRCEKVEYGLYLNNGKIPASCVERGGREAEVYELGLVNREQKPVLLEMGGEDLIVGKEYQNTSSLPY